MRLAKYLAHAGVASRRAAEQLVFAGRVTVGGEVVRDPARDVTDDATSRSTAAPSRERRRHVVYALNKPAGVREHGEGPAGAADGGLARPAAASACTRSAGWTPTRPA